MASAVSFGVLVAGTNLGDATVGTVKVSTLLPLTTTYLSTTHSHSVVTRLPVRSPRTGELTVKRRAGPRWPAESPQVCPQVWKLQGCQSTRSEGGSAAC